VAAAAANFIGFGILFSFGLFLTPLADAFEVGTGAVAPILAGSVFCYYIASAGGGRLADRHGARPVVTFAAVALPAGLVLASLADALWQVYLIYVPLVGLAVGACYSPLIGVVGRRFTEQRALAIAVVVTGVGGGTLVFPLVIRALLDSGDWRFALRWLAVPTAAVLVATAVVVGPGTTDDRSSTIGFATLARSARFRRLYCSVVLIAPGFFAPLAFLNDYAVDRGIQSGAAAALLSLIGLTSFVTRVGFGSLAPRIGPLNQYRMSHGMMLGALVLWALADGSYPVLAASAGLHGLGWAAWVTAAPVVLADWFGVGDLGLLVGGFYTGLGIGGLVGPSISGVAIERFGYQPTLLALVAVTVASVTLLLAPFGGEPAVS
jgi:MFS family permease